MKFIKLLIEIFQILCMIPIVFTILIFAIFYVCIINLIEKIKGNV